MVGERISEVAQRVFREQVIKGTREVVLMERSELYSSPTYAVGRSCLKESLKERRQEVTLWTGPDRCEEGSYRIWLATRVAEGVGAYSPDEWRILMSRTLLR